MKRVSLFDLQRLKDKHILSCEYFSHCPITNYEFYPNPHNMSIGKVSNDFSQSCHPLSVHLRLTNFTNSCYIDLPDYVHDHLFVVRD